MPEQIGFNFDAKDNLYDRLFADVSKELLAAFKAFHKENPEVYELFKRFAIEAKATGRKRFSHWMIANRIRWYSTVETQGDDYKLNNNFIAVYARLLIWQMPEFEGFFSLRQCDPDRGIGNNSAAMSA